jgi:hypothetical protein
MDKNSVLKKQFKERDVQRLRNLVTKKYGDKTTQSIGYTKAQEFHNEGDIWEENSRKWTIKNGVKQNITKLDKAKEKIILPLFCPSCKSLMKHKYDKLFYIQFNHCFNCQLKYEDKLKCQGLWEEQDKQHINNNVDNMIKDFEIWINELINTNETYVTETGDIEKWVGSAKSKLIEHKDEALKYLQSLKR